MMRRKWRAAGEAACAGAVLMVASCTDLVNPVGPGVDPRLPGGPAATPSMLQLLDCRADVAQRSVECLPYTPPSGAGFPSHLLVGGQNVYVRLTSSNVDYNGGTGNFTFDVTVRNLIPQPLGTADTTMVLAPDPNGVRVFFHVSPTVTAGSGTITVVGDGIDSFTGSNQPYFQYNTVLQQFAISSPKTWLLQMPPSVSTFSFVLLVAAAVPHENGYVDLLGNFNQRSGLQRQITPVLRTVVGNVDPAAVTYTWLATDSTRAKVDDSGLVHALRHGSTWVAVLTDETTPRRGKQMFNVAPIRRYWTGGTGTPNWEAGANWLPDSIKPQPGDTAVVTDTIPGGNPFPTLFQNESVGGLEVEDLTPGGIVPTVQLSAFNLAASGDVFTTNTASIASSTGRLQLTGIARTFRGTLPRLLVSGTYSMNGNVTARSDVRVDQGRVTNTSFRLQASSF